MCNHWSLCVQMTMAISAWLVTAQAQPFQVLHTFSLTSTNAPLGIFTNSEGATPSEVVVAGDTLYGTTQQGGLAGFGSAFAVKLDGSGFQTLHTFGAAQTFPQNNDGMNPLSGLLLSGNTLYGTTAHGGTWAYGTVFALSTDGSGITNLHNFTSLDGAHPGGGLVLSGDTLYGTAAEGGSGQGTVFALKTDGTGFKVLHAFVNSPDVTNSEGGYPRTTLVLSGDTLYGSTSGGGAAGSGTIFKVTTNGTGFATLHNFTAVSSARSTNSDGALPAGLLLSGDTLYGTAEEGGSSGLGTVFSVKTDGTGFTALHHFTANPAADVYGYYTNSDGVAPLCRLCLVGHTLYGTTSRGGSSAIGTVFRVHTDGTGFETIYNFTAWGLSPSGTFTNGTGGFPLVGVVLAGNTLYGAGTEGGASGYGTVFGLTLAQPPLTAIRFGAYLAITWPTNFTGFALQSTTNLTSPSWVSVPAQPNVANGKNIVVQMISGDREYFRLSQ